MSVRSSVAAFVMALTMLLSVAPGQGRQRQSDGDLFQWNGRQWMQVDGWGTRISVAPDGSPWVVNSRNEIHRFVSGSFEKLPGMARDIAVGSDGTAWVIGTDDGVYRWTGRAWDRVKGAAGVAISVDRSGAPWVVSASNEIYHWQGEGFILRSGRALDIGAGTDVWIIGTDKQVYRRGPNAWTPMGGSGDRITAGAEGTAWVVNQSGQIFLWANGAFSRVAGTAMDIGANANGNVWMVGSAGGGRPGRARQR
jgi:hypothetical protein